MSAPLTKPCDFCGQLQAEKFLTLKDLRLNLPGSWNLVRCENCGLLMIDPQPGWEELSAHYPKEYHAYLRKDSRITTFLREFGLRKRVASILRRTIVQKGKLLDLGCATGDFLQKFHDMSKWDVTGVEIVPGAAAAARAKGLRVIEEDLEDAGFADNSFDVVTLWDVLEHMPNPSQTLQVCFDLLKPGGLLAIKSPDPAGKEALFFKENWIGFEAPQHLFSFPKAVLVKKLNEVGFSKVNTIQTGSDYSSFFISFGHWLKKHGRLRLSKFIIRATHKPIGRIIAGIMIRPIRWLEIESSCTYFCKKQQ
ncbi:MAG: class I SAM-dependent methyltransferase [Anaerolineaceae bacterium]